MTGVQENNFALLFQFVRAGGAHNVMLWGQTRPPLGGSCDRILEVSLREESDRKDVVKPNSSGKKHRLELGR